MNKKIWFGVYDLYPEAGPVLKGRFDKEADALEYVELLNRKYPSRKYALLRWDEHGWDFVPV